MRVLFLGDVVGKTGRDAIIAQLPRLRAELALDFVVVNGENAAAGFGITGKICQEFYEVGVDVLTGGNHSWDQREIIPYISNDPRLLRPVNFPAGTPGLGAHRYALADGRKVAVINVMCRLFMDTLDDPFVALERELTRFKLKHDADFVLVDVHGEATSEKQSLGYLADGRASLVVGTHTHVPSADYRILPGGTAYQSDAGMCGDYDSVIGMKKEIALRRFMSKMPGERMAPAEGPATICGLLVDSDEATGLARHVAPLRLGGKLDAAWPLPQAFKAVAE